MKSLLRPLVALVAAAFALPALAQSEVVLWHGYRAEEKAALEKVVAQFNQAQAGKIKVTTLAVPYDAFADKISAAVPRGKGPDIFIYAQDRLGGWIEAGNTVEPIDFFLDKAITGRFLPSAMEAMTYQKQVFGLPLNVKAISMIYNKKLVPTPPKTSGELVKVAKKLTDANAGRFGLAYSYADFYYHASLMNAFGGTVFAPDRKVTLNSENGIKALDLLLRWLNTDKILPKEPSTALITSLFNEGKAGMVFSGPWFLGEIAKGVDYAIAPLPAIDEAGGKPMRPWLTVEGVYIAAPSKQKEAAWEFVKYITDAAAAKALAVEGRQIPANNAAWADPALSGDAILSAFRKQAEVGIPMPNLAEMTMAWSPATTMMTTITNGSATPKAAIEAAAKSIEKDVAALRSKKK